MRVVAIVGSHNEAVYVRACLDNYIAQGVEVYLLDNDSTDDTVEIARTYLGRGLIRVETFPRHGQYEWLPLLRRKEVIADEILADWYFHADIDEIRTAPARFPDTPSALRDAQEQGYNTVNFKNFLFMPVAEAPDHFHPLFAETMRWYRYMEPSYPNQVKGWRRQKRWSLADRVRRALGRPPRVGKPSANLSDTGGHKVQFPGSALSPEDFIMKHYQVLSLDHAVRKYVEKTYAESELKRGWHGWKARAQAVDLRLPPIAQMREFTSNAALDTSDPIRQTLIYAAGDRQAVEGT